MTNTRRDRHGLDLDSFEALASRPTVGARFDVLVAIECDADPNGSAATEAAHEHHGDHR